MEDKNLPLYKVQRALIIDDLGSARNILFDILDRLGFENIVTASSGEEVLNNCRAGDRYDVIFCDYYMGDLLNGQQLLDEMSEIGYISQQTIFIMVTADASREVVLSALEFRPDYYITKPFNTAAVKSRLDSALEEKQLLSEVYECMDKGDLDQAIAIFEKNTAEVTKKTVKQQRFYTDLLIDAGRYEEALNIYDDLLKDKRYDWARLGRARCLRSFGRTEESIKQLQEMVETVSVEMEAYDALAEQLITGNHTREAQSVLEKGLSLSPNSFTRQKYYAAICQDLKDHEKSIRAQMYAMKSAKNTRHNKAENYVELAATQIKYAETLTKGAATDMLREAERNLTLILDKIEQSSWPSASTKLSQAVLAEKNLQKDQRDQLVKSALEILMGQQECSDENSQIMFDCVDLLQQLHRDDDAVKLLSRFGNFFPDRMDITSRIDRLSPTPVSDAGRKQMDELNRKGVALFKNNRLEEAIEHYQQAAITFPNCIAFQLNYIAVVIKNMEVHGVEADYMDECELQFKKIQQDKCSNDQLDKYKKLRSRYSRLAEA